MPKDVVMWNISGAAHDKAHELRQFFVKHGVQIAVLVETHLAKGDKPPFIDGYNSSLTSFSNRASGVIQYNHNRIHTVHVTALSCTALLADRSSAAIVHTTCNLLLRAEGLEMLYIASVYVPPSSTRAVVAEVIRTLKNVVDTADNVKAELIITGDLNCEAAALGGRVRRGSADLVKYLSSTLKSANARLAPATPTHVTARSQSTIDHALSVDASTITALTVVAADDPDHGPTLPHQPHRMLCMTVPAVSAAALLRPEKRVREELTRRLSPNEALDFGDRVVRELNARHRNEEREWSPKEEVDMMAIDITLAITSALSQTRANRPPRPRRRGLQLTRELATAINARKRAIAAIFSHRKLKPGVPLPQQLRLRKAAADKVRTFEVRRTKALEWHRLCERIGGGKAGKNSEVGGQCDWRAFNRTVGSGTRHQPTAIRGVAADGTMRVLQPAQSLNLFAEQYGEVFRPSSEWQNSSHRRKAEEEVQATMRLLSDLPTHAPPVNPEELEQALCQVPAGKSPGRDGITNDVLKVLPSQAKQKVAHLIHAQMLAGHVPATWKLAKCIALFKSGDPSETGNYRLIALQNTLLKLTETVILNRMKAKTGPSAHHRLQFGFRAGRSTADALQYVHHRLSVAQSRGGTYIAFLDVQKAFDTVDNDVLLNALTKRNATPTGTWKWIASFLQNRLFYVETGVLKSAPTAANSGTPQGSVLSPELFLTFFDELLDVIDRCGCDAVAFADDIAIIPRADDERSAARALKVALAAATLWAEQRGLKFNTKPGKSAVMFVRRKGALPSNETFSLAGQPLNFTEKYKYLGVWFDQYLTMSEHKAHAIEKTRYALNLVSRTITAQSTIPPKVVRTLIISFVLPNLLYGSHVVPYSPQDLRGTRSLIVKVLKRALDLKIHNPHGNSLFVEFQITPPYIAVAAAATRYTRHLENPVNGSPTALQWKSTQKDACLPEDALWERRKMYGKLFDDPQDQSAMAAVFREFRSERYGAPLRAAINASDASYPLRPPRYLSLPRTSAKHFASVRLDSMSYWRAFKSAKATNPSCALCNALVGDALHLLLHCPAVAHRRPTTPQQSMLDPVRGAPLNSTVDFIRFLADSVKGR